MRGLALFTGLVRESFAALGRAWSQLWFRDSPTTPLELCRIGIGALLLLQFGLATPYLLEFWGDAGWMPRELLVQYLDESWVDPRFVQSIFLYFTAPWQWIVFHILFLLCCLALMLGWWTSWVKWLVFVGKVSYDYRNPAFVYGADSIICCVLFVLCFAPIGRALSLDRVRAVRAAKRENLEATLPRYMSPMAHACTLLIQLQMAVLFFYSAISKLRYDEWWTGDALWYVFTLVDYYNPFVAGMLARHYWLSAVGTYGTILIEIAFPFLIWQRRTRPYLLAAAIFLHLAFALLMQLIFFASAMITGHMSFVRPEWLARLGAWWKRKIGDMEMIYDGHCGFCVRSMAWLLAFDGAGQIKVRDFRTNPSPVVADEQLEKSLYLVLPGGRALPGFEAYRHVVLRVPGLWWLVPFFYVPVLSRLLGHPIYDRVAANRGRLSNLKMRNSTDDPKGRGDEAEARSLAQDSRRWPNLAVLFASTILSLVLVEIGYRAAVGLPILKLTNWRTEQATYMRFGAERVTTDPVLGWTNSPWAASENFQTIDYGIRRNFDEITMRIGEVLAVGDSFTEGWEVEDSESWPAVLEKVAGVPVVNAGIGAYATDQIILRAQQLLPIVKPKILIIGFLEDDIFRTGYSIFGAPKPYFTIENSELRYHSPGPLEPRQLGILTSLVRDGLGYFAFADYVLARLDPDYWYGTESDKFDRRTDINEVEVTCALLRRLKAQTDQKGIHTILFMQYTAQGILTSNTPTQEAQNVMACARGAGIRVADQFSLLQGVAARDRDALKEYYVYRDRDYGHMSAKGNRHAAHQLANELQDWLHALPSAH